MDKAQIKSVQDSFAKVTPIADQAGAMIKAAYGTEEAAT